MLIDALTYRFGSVNAANLDVFNAAVSGLARSRFCLAMGCDTLRFAFDWFVEVGGAAKLDAMLSAAMGGFARSWFCPVMGFAMARFALNFWLAALIAACGGAATLTMNCFQFVFFTVMLSVWMLLWFLVPGTERTRILSVFLCGAAWNTLGKGKWKEQKIPSCV